MMGLHKIIIISFCFFALSACVQDPASIVKKTSSSKTASESINKNPFILKVKEGDTLYSISKEYGIPIRSLIELNRLRPPYKLQPSQIVRLPKAKFHSVKSGDTIYAISRSYGVDIARLIRLNNMSKPYNIFEGKKLKIPSASFQADESYVAGTANSDNNSDNIRTVVAKDLGLLDKNSGSSFVLPSKRNSNAPSPTLRASTFPSPALKPGAKYAKTEYQKASYNYRTYDTKSSKGFAWPVRGRVISKFGPKKGGLYNDGINISAERGSDIIAANSGEVVYSGNELRGYGNLVLIKHDNGYLTAYAHADEILVKKGDRVGKGQPIGKVGSSGHVSSPQLHFSIRKGRKAIDPKTHLPRNFG